MTAEASGSRGNIYHGVGFRKEFCKRTTFHGFFDYYIAPGPWWRAMWGVLVFCSFVGVSWQIASIISSYINDPILTNVKLVSNEPIPFPMVQICNFNLVNKTKLRDVDPVLIFMALAVANSEVAEIPMLKLQLPTPSFEELFGELGLDATSERDPVAEFMNLTKLDLQAFMLMCSYQGAHMPCAEIAQYNKQPGGMCVVIKDMPPQMKGGVGLAVLLDVHSELADPRFAFSSPGVSIRIEERLNPASKRGILISPGTRARIQITAEKFALKSTNEYIGCKEDMERRFHTYPYEANTCRFECLLRELNATCKCHPPLDPKYSVFGFDDGVPPCEAAVSPEAERCKNDLFLRLSKDPNECLRNCLPRCTSWIYKTSLSYDNFPSPLLQRRPYNNRLGVDWRGRRGNLILLEILFEDLFYTATVQEPAMSGAGFLSQIGGQLGLFLGASMLSVVQAVMLMIQSGAERWADWKRRRKHAQATTISNSASTKSTRVEAERCTCPRARYSLATSSDGEDEDGSLPSGYNPRDYGPPELSD